MQEWKETHLKGRMAETLVFDLLSEARNEVYQIGYEHILPGLANPESAISRSKVGQKISKIPDLFVLDKGGNPYLVEVKFRWNPEGHESDTKKLEYYKEYWPEAIMIFVNCYDKPYFRYVEYPYDKKLLRPLNEFGPFAISQALLDKFNLLVEKYFSPTLYKK